MQVKSKQSIGMQAEQAAADYLKKQRLKMVMCNFRCTMGEIDIIMREDNTLVFVEVRLRNTSQFASALESVDKHKQTKLRKTAEYYLQQQKITDKLACRFDVVAVHYQEDQPVFEWIQNAF